MNKIYITKNEFSKDCKLNPTNIEQNLVYRQNIEADSRVIIDEGWVNKTDVFWKDSSDPHYYPVKSNDKVSPSRKSMYIVGERIGQRVLVTVFKTPLSLRFDVTANDTFDNLQGMLLQRVYSLEIKIRIFNSLLYLKTRKDVPSHLGNLYLFSITKRNTFITEGKLTVDNMSVRNELTKILNKFGLICLDVRTEIKHTKPVLDINDPRYKLMEIDIQEVVEKRQAESKGKVNQVKAVEDVKTHNITSNNSRKEKDLDAKQIRENRYADRMMDIELDIEKRKVTLAYSKEMLEMMNRLARENNVRIDQKTMLLLGAIVNEKDLTPIINLLGMVKNHRKRKKKLRNMG